MKFKIEIITLVMMMLVFAGTGCNGDDPVAPGDPADTTAPARVNNLRVQAVNGSIVTVVWTAPGDDNDTGTAAEYDIRYSPDPITITSFANATTVAGAPAPAASGTEQTVAIDASGLAAVYVALKTADEVPNWSAMSNVVVEALTAPFIIHQLTTTHDNSEPFLYDGVITWVRNLGIDGEEIYMKDLDDPIFPITRVSFNGGEKKSPSNVGTHWIVWSGRETPMTDWEIYFDTRNGDHTATQHTDNSVWDTDPVVTSAGNFVWLQGSTMFEEVRHYNSSVHEERSVSESSCPTSEYSNGPPAADHGNVVWRSYHRGDDEHKATLWFGSTWTTEDLTDEVNANTATDFSIDDGELAYQSGGNGIWITYWDGATALPIEEGITPSIYDGRIAYVVYDGDYEIHYWDGQTIHEITDNTTHDAQPCLYGDVLVWVGHPEGGAGQIFYAELTGLSPASGAK